MMQFVRTFLSMRAYGVRLIGFIAIKGVRNYRKIVCMKNVFENGWWEDAYPLSLPSGFAPGHKLQKPPKNPAYCSHLAPLELFFFTKRRVKRGVMAQCPPLNKLLRADLDNENEWP